MSELALHSHYAPYHFHCCKQIALQALSKVQISYCELVVFDVFWDNRGNWRIDQFTNAVLRVGVLYGNVEVDGRSVKDVLLDSARLLPKVDLLLLKVLALYLER